MDYPSPYTLVSKIGKGGMAEVFKAIKKGPDGFEKTVALKKILPYYTDHPQFISMLSLEAKIHSQLDHPNIVQLYDFFQFDQQYMISMEYVDGKNAKELIASSKQHHVELPWQASVYVITEVLKALHYAHNKKNEKGPLHIVHRDISPHNILISYDGRVKLSDFGIANACIKEDKTKSGVLKGKYKYLAPEQVTGEEITPVTDIFSTGVTLYELLSFTHPFSHEQEFELFKSIVQGDYKPIEEVRSDLPIELVDTLMVAMQPSETDRFQNAKAFLDELLSFQDSSWLSFGAEHLSQIMLTAFPTSSRVEIPIESTKVLEDTKLPSSIVSNHSLIEKSIEKAKPISKSWKLWTLFSLFGVGLALYMFISTQENKILPSMPTVTTSKSKTTPNTPNELQQTKTQAEEIKPKITPNKVIVRERNNTSSSLGLLTFSGPKNTEVFVNGKKIGSLPMRQYFLPPGTYLVLLKHENQKSIKSVKVHAGQTHHVELQ